MDPLLCDQFQLLAADEVRSFLIDGSQHRPYAIDFLLNKLHAITKSRAPGGIKDYTRYLKEVLCSYELSWYQQQNATQMIKIATLPLLFPGLECTGETLRLLIHLRYHNAFYKGQKSRYRSHCTLQITKAMNNILSNASHQFSHAFLCGIIGHTKNQYAELQLNFEQAYPGEDDLYLFPTTSNVFSIPDMQTCHKVKAEEDKALRKCPSTECPLRKMLNRYIAVIHHEISIVAHCHGLPREIRGMVAGWTLVAEHIEAHEVRVGKWEVTRCPCGVKALI